MSVVAVERQDALPGMPVNGEWTVDDLKRLPDDVRRYELFDGVLVVSPSPGVPHQRASRAIFRLLSTACPPELEVFYAPFDYQPTERRSFQPDILVVNRSDVKDDVPLDKPLLLAVEVLSRSTRSLDTVFKREMYATSWVGLFWIFDPDLVEFVVYERDDGRYVETARAKGYERLALERPYPVEICPAEIVKG